MDRPAEPNRLPSATSRAAVATAGAVAMVAGPGRSGRAPDASGSGGDADGFVCPFCGETYAGSRRRCASCGGLPIVPREDREVYETVVGPCGPNCDTGDAARPDSVPRPTAGPR